MKLPNPKIERVKVIDISQRRVSEGEDMYRFAWVLHYHDGRVVPQYRDHAGVCLQTRFALIPHSGVKEVHVFDLLSASREACVEYPVPADADVDILYTRSMTVTESLPQGIVFNFGWRSRDTDERWYLHIDPNCSPIKVWEDTKRSAAARPKNLLSTGLVVAGES